MYILCVYIYVYIGAHTHIYIQSIYLGVVSLKNKIQPWLV